MALLGLVHFDLFGDEFFLESLFFDFFLNDFLVVGLFEILDGGLIEVLFYGSLSFGVVIFLSVELFFSTFVSEDGFLFLECHVQFMVVDSFDLSFGLFGVCE